MCGSLGGRRASTPLSTSRLPSASSAPPSRMEEIPRPGTDRGCTSAWLAVVVPPTEPCELADVVVCLQHGNNILSTSTKRRKKSMCVVVGGGGEERERGFFIDEGNSFVVVVVFLHPALG